jgi:tetratricopeptide (TPR) repeat protein
MRIFIPGLLLGAVLAAVHRPGEALAATCEKWAGKVVSAQGVVEVKRAGQAAWEPVRLNEAYCPGDTVRTDRKSRADIALYNHPVLRLDQGSTVTLGGMKDERTSVVDMLGGVALFFSRVTRNLEVRTATVNAGVEGTEFLLRVDEGRTDLTVFEGKVIASNAVGGIPVVTGQSATAEAGKAPVYRVVVRPRDAVRWALYYPPILGGGAADRKEEGSDPRFYTERASRSLSVGRVEEASADLEAARRIDPGNSDAMALQSIVAVTRNDRDKAFDLAREAVAANPKSAAARMALSHAQQARFDLPAALGSMVEAVKCEPGNALAWARLAELQQSSGELDRSLESAAMAAKLDPSLSRTQTVLGFARLARVETGEAAADFGRAISLDPADPLPRLGLGLARIREGKLEEGRRELEVAITLDPDSGLLRSYLGKAYFEEKRDKLAAGQLDMAKGLDPLDPTPFFYDAIRKQSVNRPVEALGDLQRAVELNDNRAVYRSRLLLDSDLAARSASLARIYSDLGFRQRALVEGWKSVEADPSEFSGHRFLADSYAALPRHEIARVSELLQSQLLQPANITPIQPRLAESDLFTSSGAGPSDLSFNEFNPLFQRNGATVQATGILGNHDTGGEEVVVSGIRDKASFSIGQSYSRTDGVRENNDVKDQVVDAFLQYNLTPRTSVQAEYRYRDNRRGDVELLFWRDNIDRNLRTIEERQAFRVGFLHSFSRQSDLIGNFSYNKGDSHSRFKFFYDPAVTGIPPPPVEDAFNDAVEEKAYTGELQHIFKSARFKTVAGAGCFKIDQDLTVAENVTWPGTVPPTELFAGTNAPEFDIAHYNVYLYSYINPVRNLTLTAGASGDFFRNDDRSPTGLDLKRNQFNPKLGVSWDVLPATTVRGAVFRTLKRTLVTNQTLEPTQVAGFNQFYDDPNATEAWVYGGAVDQKFSKTLFGGAEISRRKMTVPFLDASGPLPSFQDSDWSESAGRVYLYWALHEWLALRCGYGYEKFDRDDRNSEGIRKSRTHSVPLGASFSHPSGLSAGLAATYYDQEGEFLKKDFLNFDSGSSRFWVVDLPIQYRLPKRYGFVGVGATNLFDRKFDYADTDVANPRIQPGRSVYARVTLALP